MTNIYSTKQYTYNYIKSPNSPDTKHSNRNNLQKIVCTVQKMSFYKFTNMYATIKIKNSKKQNYENATFRYLKYIFFSKWHNK